MKSGTQPGPAIGCHCEVGRLFFYFCVEVNVSVSRLNAVRARLPASVVRAIDALRTTPAVLQPPVDDILRASQIASTSSNSSLFLDPEIYRLDPPTNHPFVDTAMRSKVGTGKNPTQ